jgi:hypothetical protein
VPLLDDYIPQKRKEAIEKLNSVINNMELFKKEHPEMTPSMMKCSGNNSVLHAAIYLNQVELVRRLLDLGSDPNARGSEGAASSQAQNLRHSVYQKFVGEEESGGETDGLSETLESLDKILELLRCAMGDTSAGDSGISQDKNIDDEDDDDEPDLKDDEGSPEHSSSDPGPSQEDLALLKEVIRKISKKSSHSRNPNQALKSLIGTTLRLQYGHKFQNKEAIRSFFRRVLSCNSVRQIAGKKNMHFIRLVNSSRTSPQKASHTQPGRSSDNLPILDQNWAAKTRQDIKWCRRGDAVGACIFDLKDNCHYWHRTLPFKHPTLLDDGKCTLMNRKILL